MKTIYIGILAGRISQSEKNFFLLHTDVPAGFISTNENTDGLTETLAAILAINGAKGRRQYIRVTCPSGNLANLKCNFNGNTYILPILNISSVGLACELSKKDEAVFPPNALLRNISIRLNGKAIVCSAAVLTVKQLDDKILLILLLVKGTPYATRQAIRKYVFRTLHAEMRNKIEGETPDTTEYSDRIELDDRCAFLIDADDTDAAGSREQNVPESGTHTLTTLF